MVYTSTRRLNRSVNGSALLILRGVPGMGAISFDADCDTRNAVERRCPASVALPLLVSGEFAPRRRYMYTQYNEEHCARDSDLSELLKALKLQPVRVTPS